MKIYSILAMIVTVLWASTNAIAQSNSCQGSDSNCITIFYDIPPLINPDSNLNPPVVTFGEVTQSWGWGYTCAGSTPLGISLFLNSPSGTNNIVVNPNSNPLNQGPLTWITGNPSNCLPININATAPTITVNNNNVVVNYGTYFSYQLQIPSAWYYNPFYDSDNKAYLFQGCQPATGNIACYFAPTSGSSK